MRAGIISQAEAFVDSVRRLKQYYGIFDDYKELAEYKEINSYASSVSESEVTASAWNPNGTKIPAELYGILYEDKYDLGIGFTAITGASDQNRAVKKSSITKNIAVPTMPLSQ